jgi:hypothetical protein
MIITNVGGIFAVKGKRKAVRVHNTNAWHCLSVPGCPIMVCILETVVASSRIADVRIIFAVKGKGGVPSHITIAVHRLFMPGYPIMVGVLESTVGVIMIADVGVTSTVEG